MHTPFSELYHAGLRSTADALEAQARSLRALADAGTPEALMALQAQFVGEQFQRTMALWSSLWPAAGDPRAASTDPVRAATASLERVREGAVELADATHAEQRAA